MSTVLMTDCCCDLPYSYIKENNIKLMKMSVRLKQKDYLDDLGQSLKHNEFYNAIRENEMPQTAQVNVYSFEEAFKEQVEGNNSVIYIAFSSALSGTYNSACIAKENLLEEYPEADITIIDSRCASMGLGLLVYYANKMLKNGVEKAKIVDWVENNKLKVIHWFTVEDLNHLYRGGRVSKTAATVGTLLNIKPVMHVDDEGKLTPVSKAKGRKKSLSALVNNTLNQIVNPEEQIIFISHGDCVEDAEIVKHHLLEKLKVKDVIINYVGPVIGTHSGPGTVAVFCLGEKR